MSFRDTRVGMPVTEDTLPGSGCMILLSDRCRKIWISREPKWHFALSNKLAIRGVITFLEPQRILTHIIGTNAPMSIEH